MGQSFGDELRIPAVFCHNPVYLSAFIDGSYRVCYNTDKGFVKIYAGWIGFPCGGYHIGHYGGVDHEKNGSSQRLDPQYGQ